MAKAKIVQAPDGEPVPRETLATAVLKIAEVAEALRKSGLNRRGVIALLADKSGFSKGTISTLLDALEDLKKDYCR